MKASISTLIFVALSMNSALANGLNMDEDRYIGSLLTIMNTNCLQKDGDVSSDLIKTQIESDIIKHKISARIIEQAKSQGRFSEDLVKLGGHYDEKWCKNYKQDFLKSNSYRANSDTNPSTGDPQTNRAANQQDTSSKHEQCLEARDYEGCMRYKTGASSSSNSTQPLPASDKCFSNGWCIAENSKPDAFGFPKPIGWIYKYSPELNNIQYLDVTMKPNRTSYEINWYKVKVRGQYGRYISTRQIFRRIRPGAPGTSGYTSSTGGNRTDCKGYDNGLGTITMDCTTEAPTVIDIPGTAGRSAQNVSETLHSIIDCRDFTFVRRWVSASPRANNKEGKWKKVTSQYFGDPDAIKKDVCSAVDTLPPSSYRGYE